MPEITVLALYLWVAFSLAIAILANRYRRNPVGWFAAAAVFSPLVAWAFLAAFGPQEA